MLIDHNKAVVDSLKLFRQSRWHRNYNVEDIFRYIVAPIKYNRMRIYYSGDEPVGLITWCWLDKEAGQKFLTNEYRITEEDYVSDTKAELWGIEFVAPYGNARELMRLIRKEHSSIYGKDEKVNWRRLHDPTKRHMKEFKK